MVGIAVALLARACGGGGTGAATTPPPDLAITSQPADQSVVEGSTAGFAVTVAGGASYQWQRARSGAWTDLPGSIGATYTTAAASLGDSGSRYRVVVTSTSNPSHKLTSSEATLSVSAAIRAPVIAVQPAPLTLIAGQSGGFSVTASGTSPNFQWQRSLDQQAWTDVTDGQAATLSLVSLTVGDNGSYFRVAISNPVGSAVSQAVLLSVAAAPAVPRITSEPRSVSTVVGQAARFDIVVSGNPQPTLQWQTRWSSDSWTDLTGESRATLIVPASTVADSGRLYRVIATNTTGSVVSADALLNVESVAVPPAFVTAPADALAGIGARPSFEATATGAPTPLYQWQVSTDAGSSFSNINSATQSTLVLPPVTLADDGKVFRVTASSAAGTAVSGAALLRVATAPQIALQPAAQWWRPGETGALFEVGAVGQGLSYQWQASTDGGFTFVDIAGAQASSYLRTGAPEDPVNAVRVRVSNSGGSTTSQLVSLLKPALTTSYPRPTGLTVNAVKWLDASTAVALEQRGAVLRSADGGASWTVVSDFAPIETLSNDLAFRGPTIGLLVGSRGLIRRSTDGGLHWITVVSPGSALANALHAVAFANDSIAAAVGEGSGIVQSTDGGRHWSTAVNSGPAHVTLRSIAFSSDGAVGLAVGASGTVLRSIDQGAHWSPVTSPVSEELTSVAFTSDNAVVALGVSGTPLRSTDAGLTWSFIGGPGMLRFSSVHFGGALVGVAVDPDGQILRTTDAGTTWSLTDATRYYAGIKAIRVAPSGIVLAVGENGRLMRSTDGGYTWSLPAGPLYPPFADVAFANASIGVGIGWTTEPWIFQTTRDYISILRTTDAGASWAPVAVRREGRALGIAFGSATTGLVYTNAGEVLRTIDGGATWQPIVSIPNFYTFQAVAFAGPDTALISLGGAGLIRSGDGGATWAPVNGVNDFVRGIGFGNANVGVAVADSTVLRTTDGGITWATVATLNGANLRTVSFADDNTVVVSGAGRTVWRSTDSGVTWASLVMPEDYLLFRDMTTVKFSSGGRGIAVARGGGYSARLLRTTDAGLTWSIQHEQSLQYLNSFNFAVGSNTAFFAGYQGIAQSSSD